MEPIRPEEIKINLSEKTIEIVNTLITNNWDGYSSFVDRKELNKILSEKVPEDKDKVNNIIYLYLKFGWDIERDYPYLRFRKKELEETKTEVKRSWWKL